jgi:general secretion pathway protein B
VYAPEVPVASPPPIVAAIPAPEFGKSVNGGGPVSIKAHRRDPLLTDEDYKVNDDELLPTINEVTLTGAQALPELHLDVHVFATRPAERFVYVNMRKYHEGATLQEGPTIERIRRDGVILSYQGLRFLLPRQ